MKNSALYLVLSVLVITACASKKSEETTAPRLASKGTFGYDSAFLAQHVTLIELRKGNAAVLLVPQFEGRVMTSTCEGSGGQSFGWINYALVASGQLQPHMNAYGGEERLWLGPEGGQYSVFFKPNVSFSVENWFTPKEFDSEPFEVDQQGEDSVVFHKSFELTNRAGTTFHIGIRRTVCLLDEQEIDELLHIKPDTSINVVAYESRNVLTNEGDQAWKKSSGLLSIWMLGQMIPSPDATIILPVKAVTENGPKIKSDYFGEIPATRLSVMDSVVFFKADGQARGKVGISPSYARPFIGSYDAQNQVLTLLHPEHAPDTKDYVNSMWEVQKQPYAGDAMNAYNDGPLADGTQMGPFFELESSSPAAHLAPGESLTYKQVTIHITGAKKSIDKIALDKLGVDTQTIASAFK